MTLVFADEDKPTEVVVRSPPRRRDPGRTTVRSDDARRMTGSRDDALRAVENLPGVARSAFFGAGGLVLWGASPADSRIHIDGVEVPSLYHAGGLRGILPSNLVQSIDLAPGAYGADYGRALGGLVRVTTKDLPKHGFHGSISADFLDAAAYGSIAIGDKARMAGGVRMSYLDRIAAPLVPPNVLDAVPIPSYRDMQLKTTLTLRENEELSAVVLGAEDSLARVQTSADPGNVRRQLATNRFYRSYLRYTHAFDDGSFLLAVPSWGYDQASRRAAFGGPLQNRESRGFHYGLRTSYRTFLTPDLTLTVGADARASQSTHLYQGSLTLPPREGDLYVFGQAPGNDVNADAWSNVLVNVAPFAIVEMRRGPFLFIGGLRGDIFLLETSRQTPRVGQTPAIGRSQLSGALDPRLALQIIASSRLSFALAGGIYHQPPSPEDSSSVFGTPTLGLSRAIHTSVGSVARLPYGFDVESAGFYIRQDKLVARSRLPAPKLAQALTQEGEGRIWGFQVLVRRQAKDGFHGWLAYTLSRSERRYAHDAAYRLFDQDQSHLFTATAGYTWRGWTFGARFRYATGFPRTPVEGAYFDLTSGAFQPVFGAQNSVRMPSFLALDLRVQKSIQIRRFRMNAYLDWTNVTNHENPEEIVYDFDYSSRGYLLGLPTLAILGTRIEW